MRGFWKQSVESVTAFARRYKSDFFLNTEINIIGLHVAYGIFILCLTIGSLTTLYRNTVEDVTDAFASALTATSTPQTPEETMRALEDARAKEMFGVGVIVLLSTLLFGYLVARHALAPTRSALETQKRFIGNIAHELRTPLAIIKANTEVRLLDPSVSDTGRTIHRSNLEELDRISDIINNLLSMNMLMRPERIEFANVDMSKVVHRAVERLAHLVQRKPIRVRIKTAKERTVWGNASALEQIAMNILKNAIHHTPSGEIIITVSPGAHGTLEFSTRDTGTGIKRQDLFRIFEPFYRGDQARTRTGGTGSGLGLSIVSELVRMHRGRVVIQSAPGHGTNVVVTLPQGKTHTEESPNEEALNEVVADFSHNGHKRTRG